MIFLCIFLGKRFANPNPMVYIRTVSKENNRQTEVLYVL